jgi:hypothetical protein
MQINFYTTNLKHGYKFLLNILEQQSDTQNAHITIMFLTIDYSLRHLVV